MDNTCKECNEVFNSSEQVRRHLRKHAMNAQEYSLKWDYNNVIPKCACGCGLKTSWHIASKNFTKFVHGHHAWGRKKTEDEKRRIGEKNSVNMKRYMVENPDVARSRVEALRFGRIPDVYKRVSESVRRFWSSGSDLAKQRRKEASDRAIVLLEQGKIGPHAPFKACWFENPFTGKEERMHSSWETAFLSKCITEGYPVTKQHDLRIPYVANDGTDHVYVPDFIALEEKVVFEIKGLMRENDDLKLRALNAWAERNGYEVVLVSEVSTDI